MKKIMVKIGILIISFVIFSISVYATEENTISNTVSNEAVNQVTKEEKKEEPPTETARNEIMYVQERCNIRAGYSIDSQRVGGLDVGTEVTVVAEYSNGWYKINYDGGEAYIKGAILRTTKPEIPEPTEELPNENEQPENPGDTSPTETLAQPGENQDEVDNEYAELINEIGVLPEVGHNIADVLFWSVMLVAIGLLMYVKYKG